MVGAINDTSKRVTTAFAQIHNAEERTRDFAAASSDWFWEMDANLRYTYLSDRYEDISGNKIEDRVGTQRWEVFTSNDSTERWNDHKADLDARRPFRNFEYILTSGNGKKIFVSASGIPLFDEAGTFIGYRGSTSNITERKIAEIELREARDELEIRVHERTKQLQSEIEERKRIETHLIDVNIQAEAANRAKTEFLANMSHELRTPLNAIIGFSETLKQNIFGALANEKQEEYVVDIYNSGQHLLGLINDILDVSAIEAGKIHLHETEIDLKKVADDAIIMANPRAEIGKIELVNFVKDEGVRLLADERRIKQILVNLLINSVKYTLEKGTVEIHGGLEDNGTFFYEIIDPGIGMDEQGLKSAMEKFGQIHTTLGISNEGTGLGLPVSNGLIKAHGGTLHLESEPGVGTTVRIEFPKDRIVQLNDSIKANTGG